ncbi:MAG TPA: glycosyltransferase family 9 protein [Thermoanaerobaculia bacterium]
MRILLLRTSALGDVVHALPVLTALRRHLPEAHLGWVVEEAMAPLLAGHPDLDELVVVRLRAWGRQPFAAATRRGVVALLAAFDRFAPDVVLDLMGNHKAGALAALTFCGRRIGAAYAQRREPSSALWINEPVAVSGAHAVDRGLSLLSALALPREPADFGGDKLLRGAAPGPLPDEPYVLLHPGAGWANKRDPPAYWGQATRLLRDATDLPTLIAVAPGEEGLAREVEAASGGAARAVLASDLPALAALTRKARLMLGGDTGPIHLAHALGTSVLMLLGPTDPARHGPYGAPERSLARRLPCSYCYRRLAETKVCLLDIPPREVAERAVALLAAGSDATAATRPA